MKTKKWMIGLILGAIFGGIVSLLSLIIQLNCPLESSKLICNFSHYINLIAYLPSIYMFLPVFSYTSIFMSDNFILTIILLLIPILQYSIIGSIIVIVCEKFLEIKNESQN